MQTRLSDDDDVDVDVELFVDDSIEEDRMSWGVSSGNLNGY